MSQKEMENSMNKLDFNQNWKCFRTGHQEEMFDVTIPHDAMLRDKRNEHSAGGVNTGWIDAADYTYEKTFLVPEDYREQKVMFEFEGIYHKATVYINDKKAGYHHYGYTGFWVDASEFLRYDGENVLRVEVQNSDQPNSRWYSGTGIYRPVWMCILPQGHIEPETIRITPLEYKIPTIRVSAAVTGCGKILVEIFDSEQVIYTEETFVEHRFEKEIVLPDAKLWNPDRPDLYTCRMTFGEDIQEETFGIRVIECTSEKGFCINGNRVILQGACIHHDNGLLGACAYEFAERRKIRILKENGYNAVRSAHNPCSKALLKACDEMGMLVLDEYVDMWYIHKTKYDYAAEVESNYREDLKAIVAKDYNHPSVVMYSTGNEVSETAQKKGIGLCGEMTGYLHGLDSTRPVTCGVNIFFNFLSSVGFGVYSDKKAEKETQNTKKKKAVGSEFFNNLAGLLGADFMKFGATLYPCDIKTRDAFANMDVAGYNYGIFRYRHDLKKYPQRLILGSETFCSDVWKFREIAKKEHRLIGDFVWSGMDYLGEVGIGAWEYKDYAPRFDKGMGWLGAGAGRIDLTGKPLAEMKYTRVVFGLDDIGIGVIPVKYAAQPHSSSAWKMTNAVESWSWNGCNGMKTKVEVYTRAAFVSLFINGTCVGTKKGRKDCRVVFDVRYYDGEIKAVAYDAGKRKTGQLVLKTAGEETKLCMEPEQEQVRDTQLCYVRMRYADETGILKPLCRGDIKVKVKGGTLLGLGNACPYNERGYLSDVTDTYYGEAMAVIRPEGKEVCVEAESPFGNARTLVKYLKP